MNRITFLCDIFHSNYHLHFIVLSLHISLKYQWKYNKICSSQSSSTMQLFGHLCKYISYDDFLLLLSCTYMDDIQVTKLTSMFASSRPASYHTYIVWYLQFESKLKKHDFSASIPPSVELPYKFEFRWGDFLGEALMYAGSYQLMDLSPLLKCPVPIHWIHFA